MSAAAGGAAAAAAAAAARRRREEEQAMTPYTDSDLAQGWEFKILRSTTGAFKKPEALRAALEEEAKCGWVLLEKFDNSRVRLKRPSSVRAADTPGRDPYRTTYGIGEGALTAIIVGCVLGAVGIVIAVVIALTAGKK